jgi:hypothetical protein
MISNQIIIIIIGISFRSYSVSTQNFELIQKETDILYSHIKTQPDLNVFYQKLLESNDINDPTRIHRIVTTNDPQLSNFEHKVNITLFPFCYY